MALQQALLKTFLRRILEKADTPHAQLLRAVFDGDVGAVEALCAKLGCNDNAYRVLINAAKINALLNQLSEGDIDDETRKRIDAEIGAALADIVDALGVNVGSILEKFLGALGIKM